MHNAKREPTRRRLLNEKSCASFANSINRRLLTAGCCAACRWAARMPIGSAIEDACPETGADRLLLMGRLVRGLVGLVVRRLVGAAGFFGPLDLR